MTTRAKDRLYRILAAGFRTMALGILGAILSLNVWLIGNVYEMRTRMAVAERRADVAEERAEKADAVAARTSADVAYIRGTLAAALDSPTP